MRADSKFTSLIEAVVFIALTAKPNAVRGQEVCKTLNLPERYLEPEFQTLVKRGVLRSVRGPKGGYVLAKERRNISLADIYGAIKHNIETQPSEFAKAAILPALKLSEDEAIKKLGETSVEDLCLNHAAVNFRAQNTQSDGFVI